MAVLAVLGLTVAAVLVVRAVGEPGPPPLADCESEQPDDYDCWRDRLRRLVADESPAEALADARTANDTNFFFAQFCHQFTHEIGRAAGERYEDVAEAFTHGDDLCASGYYHGVMEAVAALASEDELFAQIHTMCGPIRDDAGQYTLDHYNCAHGLGHGLMAVTLSDLPRALTGCDGLTDSWEAASCHSGVFMENIMARDNPHHATEYLRDDEPLYPCTDVDDQYKNPCYLIQTSFALRVVGNDYARVFELCGGIQPAYQATCQESLGRDVSGNTGNDVDQTVALCGLGPDPAAQLHCFIGAAKDYVYHHHDAEPGLALCAAIEDPGMSETCTNTVHNFYAGFGG